MLFWWFPLTYLLNYELDESLEIKCDCNVIKGLNKSQKTEYLTALLHVYETQGDKKIIFSEIRHQHYLKAMTH